jgi:uncharacterized protein YegP (UPF0339 family)
LELKLVVRADRASRLRTIVAGAFFVVTPSPKKRDWRWYLFAPGGLLMAISGLAYASPAECIDAINALVDAVMMADPVIEVRPLDQ